MTKMQRILPTEPCTWASRLRSFYSSFERFVNTWEGAYVGGGTDDGRGSSAQDVKGTHRNLHISHLSLLPKWPNPQEHYSASGTTSGRPRQCRGTVLRSQSPANAC